MKERRLAKALAKVLFNDEKAMICFDMSEFIVSCTLGTGNTVVINVDANEEIIWNVK